MSEQRDNTLRLLRAAGPHGVTTATFLDQRIPRFSARLEELRKQGYLIHTQRVRQGSYVYRLLKEPAESDGADASGPSSPATASTSDAVALRGLFELPPVERTPAGAYDRDAA